MKSLKTIGAAAALMFVLTIVAFAGETPTGPCDLTPGQIPTLPGSCALVVDSTEPGQIETPPASDGTNVFSLAMTALALVF